MIGLHAYLGKYHAALEADLLSHYGIDLLDLYRGRLTWRRLRVLVAGLPSESATGRAMPEVRGWGVTDYLLAHLVDVAASHLWAYRTVHSRDRTPPPTPVIRPGQDAQAETTMSSKDEVKRFLRLVGKG